MGDAFGSVVGSEHVSSPELSIDGLAVEQVVRPGSPDEVAACLRVAVEAGCPLLVRGGGSKLEWGNPIDAQRLAILDTTRLQEPLDPQPDEGVACVGAGVALADLAARLAECAQRSRLDPLHPGATVGGGIASDPIGPEYAPGRRLRSDLLGLEVALPNGQLTRCGGKVVKNVTGFDLVRLYCGSMGTLGVITQANVRLWGVPSVREVMRRGCPSMASALEVAGSLLEANTGAAGIAVLPVNAGAELLWLLEGEPRGVAQAHQRFDGELAEPGSWERVREVLARPSRDGVAVRLAARPSDTTRMVAHLESVGGSGAPALALPESGVVFGRVEPAGLPPLIDAAREQRWSVLVERAPLEVRRRVEVFGPLPEGLGLMRGLKARFDPARVLAPGRFVGGI